MLLQHYDSDRNLSSGVPTRDTKKYTLEKKCVWVGLVFSQLGFYGVTGGYMIHLFVIHIWTRFYFLDFTNCCLRYTCIGMIN